MLVLVVSMVVDGEAGEVAVTVKEKFENCSSNSESHDVFVRLHVQYGMEITT